MSQVVIKTTTTASISYKKNGFSFVKQRLVHQFRRPQNVGHVVNADQTKEPQPLSQKEEESKSLQKEETTFSKESEDQQQPVENEPTNADFDNSFQISSQSKQEEQERKFSMSDIPKQYQRLAKRAARKAKTAGEKQVFVSKKVDESQQQQSKKSFKRPKVCKEAIELGLQQFNEGNYNEAIDLFTTSLELPGSGAYRFQGSIREGVEMRNRRCVRSSRLETRWRGVGGCVTTTKEG
eukprot:TRINITY_DN6449_c1_g1_i2.p1 TRINITY_DN6449_c1_g1~~TRINITY_DN6449_c1_g1_i2.p1  ORF type:complete len:237 (-),score=29.74 TRINITY_DN6449_c1_g1_i2:164-874(-)